MLLTISENQHNWYLAPVYSFVATVMAVGFGRFIHYRAVLLLIAFLIGIQSVRQNHFLLTYRDTIAVSPGFEEKVVGNTVYYTRIPQDILLKLVFMVANPVNWNITRDIENKKYILERTDESVVSSNHIGYIGNYSLFYY